MCDLGLAVRYLDIGHYSNVQWLGSPVPGAKACHDHQTIESSYIVGCFGQNRIFL